MQRIRLASFDIGKVNFAHYIEDMDVSKILAVEKKYKDLPKKLQRKTKGEVSSEMREILKDLYLSGNRIHTGVYDIRNGVEDVFDIPTRKNLLTHLYSHKYLWDECNIFVVEQQYFKTWSGRRKSPGTEANVDAIKIAECLMTWLLCEYPFKEILYFGSQNKTQMLGAPWNLDKPQRKKWAIEECRRMYEWRKDECMTQLFLLEDRVYKKRMNSEEKILSFLNSYTPTDEDGKLMAEKIVRNRQKLDDICDAALQAQAFKFKTMVACF